jgi:hypothetical protein
VQDSRSREFRFPDKAKGDRQGASCGCRKVPIRDLKSGSALRAEEREGPGDSGRAWVAVCVMLDY